MYSIINLSVGCGKEHHNNAKHGNIFSPHWPLPYPRYVDCVWHVTTRPGLHVKLVFFDFDVRPSDACAEADFVEVKTGGNTQKPIEEETLSIKRVVVIHHGSYNNNIL